MESGVLSALIPGSCECVGRERGSKEKSNRELRIACYRALSCWNVPWPSDEQATRALHLRAFVRLSVTQFVILNRNLLFHYTSQLNVSPLRNQIYFPSLWIPRAAKFLALGSSQKVSAEWINKWRKEGAWKEDRVSNHLKLKKDIRNPSQVEWNHWRHFRDLKLNVWVIVRVKINNFFVCAL